MHPLLALAEEQDLVEFPHAESTSIADIMRDCFPPLWRLVTNSNKPTDRRYVAPPRLRPLLAMWSKTTSDIWMFPGRVVHKNIGVTYGNGVLDCSNVAEMRELLDHMERVQTTPADEIRTLMLQVLQTEMLVPITRADLRESGFVMGPQFRKKLWRCKINHMDALHQTIAYRQAVGLPRTKTPKKFPWAQAEMPGDPPDPEDYEPYRGELSSCQKTVQGAGAFTGDLFVCVCACGGGCSKILGSNFMDAGESPRNVVDYLDSLDEAPEFVFYDNSCHLKLMLMSRNPHRYYKTQVLSDNFHVKNHTACSVLIGPKQWAHLDVVRRANTEAAEQTNAEISKHLSRFLHFFMPFNAMNVLELFVVLFNAKA